MKTLFNKIVAFACLLLIATAAKAATTVTIADHAKSPSTTYGTFSGSYSFTTNAASGVAGVTITATDVTMANYDLSSNQYDYGIGLRLVTSDTNSHTITLTAPSGYVITGYSIGASANSSNYPHTLTAADGTTTSGSIIGLGSNSNNFQYLMVSGLSSNSTYFTIQTTDKNNGTSGNTLYVGYFTITLMKIEASITSGKYYRLTNAAYTGRSMADGGGKVATPTTETSSYTQIWKLTKNGSTCTLQNALTDKYIQSQPGASVQYSTGPNSYSFNIVTKVSGGSTLFSFQDPNSTWYGLHSAATQSYNVVGWDYTADASYWSLERVDVDETELQNLKNTMNADYTDQLATFFDDYACTTLKTEYANMTDAQLRSAMSALPTALQDMAVCVKSNTWNSDATWNLYEKDFRIHDYEIYSNCDTWYTKMKIGRFARLSNPTGIQATTGQFLYVFVGSDVADNSATLEAELVAGTSTTGTTVTLKKGYNSIYVAQDCELFITYLLNDADKLYTNYPDIKVHVEGGTCNGCFDMHRGHTNSDWAWLKSNMFQNTYLHVKGESVLLNLYRASVVGESNVEGVMKIWDFIFDTEQSLAGCDQYKAAKKYKMMVNPFDNGTRGTNPFWNNVNHGSSHPGITSDDTFSYSSLSNVGTYGGAIWVIMHELGHGHQDPINLAGQTESSNNSLVQCVNFLTTNSTRGQELFTTTRSSRGEGVKQVVQNFNQEGGYSWIDYAGFRYDKKIYAETGTNPGIDIWTSNKFIFQLWLYFDYMGNYQPTGDNTGFSFINALYDKMRANGITKSTNSSSPAQATQDYLLLAKYAAEITETDLSEFFEAWGFWKTEPTISHDNDIPASMIWEFPDYYTYYIQTSDAQVATIKNAMQQYTKKASNIMFLEDRGTGSTLATYDGSAASTFGDVGYYGTFDNKVTSDYTATVSGTTVTMSGGEGAVGFKVYDGDGNLVAISNTKSFTVTSAVATGISNGTYTVKVAQGDGDDYIAASPGHTATHYEGETGVPYAMTEPSQLTSSTLFTMNCARGYVYYNGSVLAGTSTASSASKFAIVSYDGNTYLYDATQKAFVCHTTAATAGLSGNAVLESNSDFSKIVKNISFGTTGIEAYPWYIQENEFTNWLNMDSTPLVYFNRWIDFESGTGGNTYTITITDIDFDNTEAVAMLEAYFNPSATVTYVISDDNGVVYTSDALPATVGTTITTLPTNQQRDFCSYTVNPTTLNSGSNTIYVTVTYNLPFETCTDYTTAKWYYLRGHASYDNSYVSTSGTDIAWSIGSGNAQTDAFKWAFIGNPYEGIQVINKAAGSSKYLMGTNPATMGTTAKAWTLKQQTNASYQGYAGENGFGLYDATLTYLNTQGTTLKYWSYFDQGSTFWVEEIPITEGDLDGDGSVDNTDLNILIGIIFGTENPSNWNNADLNNDNNYGVGDVTKLVNLMRKEEE